MSVRCPSGSVWNGACHYFLSLFDSLTHVLDHQSFKPCHQYPIITQTSIIGLDKIICIGALQRWTQVSKIVEIWPKKVANMSFLRFTLTLASLVGGGWHETMPGSQLTQLGEARWRPRVVASVEIFCHSLTTLRHTTVQGIVSLT